MNIIEFLIIYLACGAPFGVYRATSRFTHPSSRSWLKIIGAFAFWPISAVFLLSHRLAKKARPKREELESLRQQIENAAFADGETQALFEFREAFYRFTGLAGCLSENSVGYVGTELFDVAGQRDAVIAARCLARANRERLIRHYAGARKSFLMMITELSEVTDNSDLPSLAAELCACIGDPLDRSGVLCPIDERISSPTAPTAAVRHA